MHPKACEIANYLAGKKVIGKVVIFSNGTLPFNENMTSLLKDPKILILFSDYGNALSRNLSKNEEICMAEDIAFLTTKLKDGSIVAVWPPTEDPRRKSGRNLWNVVLKTYFLRHRVSYTVVLF